jgi:hypothetical protein
MHILQVLKTEKDPEKVKALREDLEKKRVALAKALSRQRKNDTTG